jgi:hypothetical protein
VINDVFKDLPVFMYLSLLAGINLGVPRFGEFSGVKVGVQIPIRSRYGWHIPIITLCTVIPLYSRPILDTRQTNYMSRLLGNIPNLQQQKYRNWTKVPIQV